MGWPLPRGRDTLSSWRSRYESELHISSSVICQLTSSVKSSSVCFTLRQDLLPSTPEPLPFWEVSSGHPWIASEGRDPEARILGSSDGTQLPAHRGLGRMLLWPVCRKAYGEETRAAARCRRYRDSSNLRGKRDCRRAAYPVDVTMIRHNHCDSGRFNALWEHDVTSSAPDLVKSMLRK